MVAYEVFVNGTRRCLAGVGDDGVLTAILSRAAGPDREPDHHLHVGGYANRESIGWVEQAVAVGDVIQIRVVDVGVVDEPAERKPEDPEFVAKAEREYYERMRKRLGDE